MSLIVMYEFNILPFKNLKARKVIRDRSLLEKVVFLPSCSSTSHKVLPFCSPWGQLMHPPVFPHEHNVRTRGMQASCLCLYFGAAQYNSLLEWVSSSAFSRSSLISNRILYVTSLSQPRLTDGEMTHR